MTATGYGKAKVGTGGFTISDVEDGEYPATVKSVKDGQGKWDDQDYDQYIVEWALDGLEDDEGNAVTLAQFVRIPEALQVEGILNPDSNLFKLIEALGYDMEEPEVEPNGWIGKRARIIVKNKAIQSGQNKGQIRPRITDVMAPRGRKATASPSNGQPAAPTREPARQSTVSETSVAGKRRQVNAEDDF